MSLWYRLSTEPTSNVSGQFDRGAARYDLMTGLNPGYHRHLRRAAQAMQEWIAGSGRPTSILDVGCGSGASTRALLSAFARQSEQLKVIGVDASVGMLQQARAKRWPSTVSFARICAEQLRDHAESHGLNEVDGIFAAYLFRNVTDPDRVARQTLELLRPGGTLVVQEYSVADSRPARWIWTAVCRGLVVPLSAVLGGHPQLYRYLWHSVLQFDSLNVFCQRLVTAGYVDVQVSTPPGWQRGILHTIRARRPEH